MIPSRERVQGLERERRTAAGFQVSVSRTFEVPVSRLFEAWVARAPLGGGFRVRKATADKSLWATWVVGTILEANFYDRGESKSEVTVRHSKLNGAEQVAAMTEYWSNDILDELSTWITNRNTPPNPGGVETMGEAHDQLPRPEPRQLERTVPN